MDVLKSWSRLVRTVPGPAEVLLVLWPACASWLALQTTVVSELIHWLLTPRVLAMSVVHAVNMFVIRLDAHGSTTILSPIRGLAAPTVTPILGHTLNEHFIPAKLACDVFWEVITAWCKRCQVIDVSVGPSKLVDIVPASTILHTLGTCM